MSLANNNNNKNKTREHAAAIVAMLEALLAGYIYLYIIIRYWNMIINVAQCDKHACKQANTAYM